MKQFRKVLSLLLALIIVAGVMTAAPLTAYADDVPFSKSGFCGAENEEDVEWYAFNDNSMVFFGSGAIKNYTDNTGSNPAPWYGEDFTIIANTLFINKIAVEYGITAIGDYSFYVADNYLYRFYIQLKNIDIADTVTSIGKYAFYNQNMEEVMLPPSVTYIGENAFKNCRSLKRINYFGNPDTLFWDTDGATDTEFYGRNMVCHILKTYASQVDAFNTKFAYKNITFVADMDNPYEGSGDELSRNIALYYGSANSGVFGGAAPYVIVGSFDGKKKSVTHGSNGFASAVQMGSDYYILTDNTTGKLNKATVNGTSGKATSYDAQPLSDLSLKIRHEYIGSNTVKVIYRIENTGNSSITDLKVGGTGDIKIGADDFASIVPLNEDDSQVGFYMKSTQVYDQSGDDFATLGFIGKSVKVDPTDDQSAAYPDANFFYGLVDASKSSAAGAKTVVLIPQRIFEPNQGVSQDSGTFEGGNGRDSGMSYYWDVTDLQPNVPQEFAVLFSVYGTNNNQGSAESMITDLSETYHTVTWENYDGTALLKTPVKHDTTSPAYTGTPEKPSTNTHEYTFSGWKKKVGDVTEDTVYTTEQAAALVITADTTFVAQYNEVVRRFFKKHSISLNGDIGMYYYIDTQVANVTKNEILGKSKKIKLAFSWYDKNAEFIIDDGTEYDTAEQCFKAKCNVNAAEMAYDIHATAYISEYNNGEWSEWSEYPNEHDIYSVREYAKVILNTSSAFSTAYAQAHPSGRDSYQNLRNLMICMLDYGAKAQVAFDRKPNDLANNIFSTYGVTYSMGNLTAEQIASRTTARDSLKDENISNVGLKYEGSSVLYLSNTSVRHYFTVVDDTKFTQGVIDADHGGFTYHTKDHGLYFEYSGIPASKLDEAKVFTIGSSSYNFSVLNYSQMVLNSTLPQADKDLAIATVWYNDAANTYFGD